MYLMTTGEPSFRNRRFDGDLICDIMGGGIQETCRARCCDADPDKRPDAAMRCTSLLMRWAKDNSDDNAWNTIYRNDVKNLYHVSRRRVKYSSTLLPTGG